MSDKYSPFSYRNDEVVRRAYSRKSESSYKLSVNNCEHFVRWCRNGSN
ncbi:lecithin retinol acyltransferase family protein [Paenibacillus sp. Root444D2]